jgi:hypothetical protein
MQIIEIKTLIDITDTKVLRLKQGTQLQYDQQRNFVTLKQCVEIRSIINYDTSPSVESVDVKGLDFGSKYKGKHLVWTWRFSPDRAGVYGYTKGDAVDALIDDVNEVPIIQKLTETVNIDKAIFELKDLATINTTIKAILGTI